MIGMGFDSFVTLLIISVVVSSILHLGLKSYVRAGTGSFISKVIIGWIGAWLGSPVSATGRRVSATATSTTSPRYWVRSRSSYSWWTS